MLSWQDVNELLIYFAEFHLPHCNFLIPFDTLQRLEEDGELLFWTIILIAARHHRKHHRKNRALEAAHSRLRADKCSEAIRKLPDLQAVLLLCMWPLPVRSQDGDTAGLRLAEALSGVRQMGLDVMENEAPSGIPRAAKRLQRYPMRIVRLTWLKCFELDVQLSLWHGVLPALAASRYFKSVTDACRSPDIPQSVAQRMGMHVHMARYLLLLDGTTGSDAAWNLAKSVRENLALAESGKLDIWSLENEAVLETCQMYICITSYVHITRNHPPILNDDMIDPSIMYAQDSLLEARDKAINTIYRLCRLTDQALSKDQSCHAGTTALPGVPKNAARLMFFATSVLLKYLSSADDRMSALQRKKDYDAFEEALRFFYCCPKSVTHVQAGHTLEVVGRAIEQRRARLQTHVTTRMGASVMHDVRWLSAAVSGREREQDRSRASTPADKGESGTNGNSDGAENSLSMPQDPDIDSWSDWCYAGTDMLPSSLDLPAFEMWDSVLDDVFQNDFLDKDLGR